LDAFNGLRTTFRAVARLAFAARFVMRSSSVKGFSHHLSVEPGQPSQGGIENVNASRLISGGGDGRKACLLGGPLREDGR
jgi:hypothetical protein